MAVDKSRDSEPIPAETGGLEGTTPTDNEKNDDQSFPDGGWRAWSVVLGSWCLMVPSFGLLNTIGVFQTYLAEHQLKDFSTFSIGWIFSLYAFFIYFGSVQIEYYHFMLGFSVLGGISASMVFTPSVACIAHWFLRRRALATGVAATAGGAGGIIFPLIVSSLTGTVGFAWAIRIIGFISAGFCGVGTLLLRTRLPRDPMKKGTIDIGALRERQFALLSAAVLLVDFALLIPLTYLPSYAQSHGMKTSLAYQLASILSAASIFGRTFSGYFADRLGRFNMMIICTFVCCVITLVLWLPARSNSAAILAYTVLFGFWSGSAISLPPVCVAQISKTEDFGKRYGTTYFLAHFWQFQLEVGF
ncbi:uncharacterized protein N7529_006576 [Penicillium soppii]|uniref:uncharacterized protein n=1 Tax=Penicillium soppii TaxID=69789 RepID=UPI0025479C3B|nr:uncharacterized protein N7529_006576 [Penicillium soppii]KAJ5864660.1 hypothetical protein N7529_006576 [Penicillium soppii]